MTEKKSSSEERKYDVDEYLRLERENNGNHEFIDGRILNIPSSGRIHSLIVTNATISVGSRLRSQNAELYAGNMRVRLNTDRYCYPSIVIVNGKPQFTGDLETLKNPTVIIEIFAPENRSNEKIESYLEMDSVKECLLIKENEMRIEHYAKQTAKQWVYKVYTGADEMISIDAVSCKTSVSEIYARIKFNENAAPAAASSGTNAATS